MFASRFLNELSILANVSLTNNFTRQERHSKEFASVHHPWDKRQTYKTRFGQCVANHLLTGNYL